MVDKDGFHDPDTGIFYNILQYLYTFAPSNIHSILPMTLSSDIQLLISPPFLSVIRQSKRPSLPSYSFRVTLIFLQSISISSCEWSSPINSAVGGEKGKAKAICLFNCRSTQCFLFMCQGTYIWILLYASIRGRMEKKSQGEIMAFENGSLSNDAMRSLLCVGTQLKCGGKQGRRKKGWR